MYSRQLSPCLNVKNTTSKVSNEAVLIESKDLSTNNNDPCSIEIQKNKSSNFRELRREATPD